MPNELTDRFKHLILKENLIQTGDRIVLGFSGGADSVALLYLLNELSKKQMIFFEVFPIYIHHGLRKNADEDIRICKHHCNVLGLPLMVQYVDVLEYCKTQRVSEEDGARTLRYMALHRYLLEKNGNKIAVAHHKDDQAETLLYRFMRGTGLLGLKGMEVFSENQYQDLLIRPLLSTSKQEIMEYIGRKGLLYVNDETNQLMTYQRNKIRHQLLTHIKNDFNPNIIDTLYRAGMVFGDENDYMELEADKIYKRVSCSKELTDRDYAVTESDHVNIIDGDMLMREHPAIIRRVLRKVIEELVGTTKNLEYIHVERILNLISHQSGKKIEVYKGLMVIKEYQRLVFLYKKSLNTEEFIHVLDRIPDKGYIQKADLWYTVVNEQPTKYKDSFKNTKNLYTKWFDYDKIKANLVLRTRKPGDIIHIDSEGHSKKIKKFFIDEKIPLSLRNQLPLLALGNHILWVPGYRVNPMYEAREDSSNIIKVELTKEDNKGYDN
jgi:tRNA(Ile)-lysidine synthase